MPFVAFRRSAISTAKEPSHTVTISQTVIDPIPFLACPHRADGQPVSELPQSLGVRVPRVGGG
jgi:hypothetical protein